VADGGPAAVFDRAGEGFVATPAARGPWAPGEAHGGAPSALLARAVERVEPAEGMAVARLTVDFLGAVPLGAPLAVAAAVVKPGRRFQLVEAELSSAGRMLCRARAVRLRRGAGPVSPGTEAGPVRPPDPHEGWEWDALVPVDGQDMFFPTAVEVRVVDGAPGTGAASAWFRLRLPLVGGESPSPLQRTAAAADFGNGISWGARPARMALREHRADRAPGARAGRRLDRPGRAHGPRRRRRRAGHGDAVRRPRARGCERAGAVRGAARLSGVRPSDRDHP